LDQITTQHTEEIAKVEQKLERIVQEMSDRAARELETVKDESARKAFQKKLTSAKAQASRELGREKEKVVPPVLSPGATAPRANVRLTEGSLVRVLSLSVTGRVTATQGGDAEVLVGNIKLRRPMSDLELVETAPPIKLPENVHVNISTKHLDKNEINV